jgi:class 3 adenylate cyclase
MFQRPATMYARSGDAKIAYQVLGDGPVDLISVAGPAQHLDVQWEDPATATGIRRLASFSRFVRYDRRGTGLSDPVERPVTLDQQMDDLDAVMRDVGVERAALIGAVDAGLAAMYAATHPDRVIALILQGVSSGQYVPPDVLEQVLDIIENSWGQGGLLPIFAPSRVGDRRFEEWWVRYERACVSPAMARQILGLYMQTDLRGVLPAVRVPTLVIHQKDGALVPVEQGREAAALIPGARFVEVPGTDAYGWGDEHIDRLVEEFLTGRHPQPRTGRVLATVVFTDVVGSTELAAQLGDRRWRELLDRHDEVAASQVAFFGGTLVKSTGDGVLATFDAPGRAVQCASELCGRMQSVGIQIRAGVHTGEIEVRGTDIGGIGVHVGARVAALAQPEEVLVSRTVRDLVVGSEIEFIDRGEHSLRGVPESWQLYAVNIIRE